MLSSVTASTVAGTAMAHSASLNRVTASAVALARTSASGLSKADMKVLVLAIPSVAVIVP